MVAIAKTRLLDADTYFPRQSLYRVSFWNIQRERESMYSIGVLTCAWQTSPRQWGTCCRYQNWAV